MTPFQQHLRLLILLTIFNFTTCKTALEHFLKNKQVTSYSLTILGNSTMKQWIEYKYFFESYNVTTKNLNGSLGKLTVGIPLYLPDKEFDCRRGTSGNFQGYSLDIVEWLKKNLNLTSAEFVEVNHTMDVENFLRTKTVDLVVCHPNLTDGDADGVVALYPSLKSRHLLLYKSSNLHFTKDIFILTFVGSLWLVFFILLTLLAVCLRITTTQYSIIHPEYQPWTWVEITLWAIAAACQQGLSHTPFGFASCCIFFVGYLTAYLLYTCFAAAITSVLLQHDYYPLDMHNFNPDKFHLIALRDSEFYTNRSLQESFETRRFVDNLHELFNSLNKDNTVGLGPEVLLNQYMSMHHLNTTYLMLKLPDGYRKSFYVVGNSSWRPIINQQLLRMEEKGILQNMLKRNVMMRPVATEQDTDSGYSSAGREHVGSAMLIWLAGVVIAIVFLLAECSLSFYKRNRAVFGL